MKKVKLGLAIIILLLVVLVGYQNRDIIFITHSFGINLGFFEYHTPQLPNIALLAGFFLLGCLLVYIASLAGKFRTRKTLKELNTLLASAKEENRRLENEVLAASSDASRPAPQEPAGEEESTD